MYKLAVILVVSLLIHNIHTQCVSCEEQGVCSETFACGILGLDDTELCCNYISWKLCGCNATIVNGNTPGPMFCENCSECLDNRVPCPTNPNNINKQLLNCFGLIVCSNTQNSMDLCVDEGCTCTVSSEDVNSTCVNTTVLDQGVCEGGEVVVCAEEVDVCVNLTTAFNLCSIGVGMYGPCTVSVSTTSMLIVSTTSISMQPIVFGVNCSDILFPQGDCPEEFNETCVLNVSTGVKTTECVTSEGVIYCCEVDRCEPGKCQAVSVPPTIASTSSSDLVYWVLLAVGIVLIVGLFIYWIANRRDRDGFIEIG